MRIAESIAWVGVSFAIAFAFVGFFWAMVSVSGPSDYHGCMSGCRDGWGHYEDLSCPKMCLQLSEDYKPRENLISCVSFENESAYSMNEIIVLEIEKNRIIESIDATGIVICRNESGIIYK